MTKLTLQLLYNSLELPLSDRYLELHLVGRVVVTDELLIGDSLADGGTPTVRLDVHLLLDAFILVVVHFRHLSQRHLTVVDRVELL